MREVRVVRPGRMDGFEEHEAAARRPGCGEVLLRVRAASLNFRDTRLGAGPPGSIRPGTVPLSCGAGEIAGVGEGVEGWGIGDRVIANCLPDWLSGPLDAGAQRRSLGFTADGMLADQNTVPAAALVKVPDELSDAEAATLPCAALSAWSALTTHGGVCARDAVVVQGSGGVSVFALQFAKAFGARVIATTSSDAKADRLRALGADHVINYGEAAAWDEAVLALTDGRGATRIVEIGGEGTLARSVSCAAVGARIAVVGFVGGTGGVLPAQRILEKHLTAFGVAMGSQAQLAEMMEFIVRHRIRPVIDHVYPFEGYAQAYARLASGRHIGKVVIRMDDVAGR